MDGLAFHDLARVRVRTQRIGACPTADFIFFRAGIERGFSSPGQSFPLSLWSWQDAIKAAVFMDRVSRY